MTHSTTTELHKEIRYDRATKDYAMRYEGQFIGCAPTYSQAETILNDYVYELLTHGGCETATALDGGQDDDPTPPVDDGEGDNWGGFRSEHVIDPPNPICAACNTDAHPASAMQPAFCCECVNAMLHGRDNRLSQPDYDHEPTFAARYIAPMIAPNYVPGCTCTTSDFDPVCAACIVAAQADMADDVPTENPDVDTTPETAGPSPLRCPRCGCGAVATIWDEGHYCAAHYLELPAPQLFCPSCLCVAEQTDIEHTPDAWRCRNPACLSVAKLDDLLTLSALIERRAALDRIKMAVFARMRALPDIALGRELCALRWQKFSSFVAMLVNAPEARLTHYASAYVAFVRDYNPESDLTPARVLREWQRLIDGPSPTAPAMRMRAA